MNSEERNTLASFLKARREKLQPEDVGLTDGRRRRTPGLRREEVAQLAGVSLTWYTWIEQGREVHFSVDVLRGISEALQLQGHEQDYVYRLCGFQPDARHTSGEEVSETLKSLVDHQGVYPAYLMGRFWQVLYWNKAAGMLFSDFGDVPDSQKNIVWYTFAVPEARHLIVDWDQRARRLVSEFRGDCGHYLDDPVLKEFVAALSEVSEQFGIWWKDYEVNQRDGGRREFNHVEIGKLVLEQHTFKVSSAQDIKLVIHVPLEEENTSDKLLEMVSNVVP